jgi:hypothetical protein
MNLLAQAHRFFVFSGLLLLGIGAVQLLSRRRGGERGAPKRPFDAATMRAVFFLVIGLVVLLLGARVLPMPGAK